MIMHHSGALRTALFICLLTVARLMMPYRENCRIGFLDSLSQLEDIVRVIHLAETQLTQFLSVRGMDRYVRPIFFQRKYACTQQYHWLGRLIDWLARDRAHNLWVPGLVHPDIL